MQTSLLRLSRRSELLARTPPSVATAYSRFLANGSGTEGPSTDPDEHLLHPPDWPGPPDADPGDLPDMKEPCRPEGGSPDVCDNKSKPERDEPDIADFREAPSDSDVSGPEMPKPPLSTPSS